MAHIIAYLNFNGKCREAMNFYQECFGGELSMQTVGESPIGEQLCYLSKDSVVHASLVCGDLNIMATDLINNTILNGNTIRMMINCGSEDEINSFFNKIASGGIVQMALTEQFWGAIYGEVTDRYGMSWMFNYDKD